MRLLPLFSIFVGCIQRRDEGLMCAKSRGFATANGKTSNYVDSISE
jgi:hypothetical protein